MNRAEASALLEPHVQRYRALGYQALRDLVVRGENHTFDETGPSGAQYQFDMLFFWDGSPEQDIRVICNAFIDPRGEQITDDFILSPNGLFVDEYRSI